ncbi:MAG: hypothetical protein JKX98_02350 [Alcanivoracaceae bacterium]|nr:hypothetical protein [Alcanivoracaceae bacterium]
MKLLLILLFSLSNIANALELNNNETVSFELNTRSVSTNLFVNVPANANSLKVEIFNNILGSDFDLFLKFGADFNATTFNAILAESNYYSAGVDANEFFTVSTAMNFPLKEGTWYVAVYNFGLDSQTINLSLSHDELPLSSPEINFIFDQNTIVGSIEPCNIDGWNDNTPFTPIAGNNATTLGEARKIAILKATELMTENLQSSVPLTIQGCWPIDLETSQESAVLANARSRSFVSDTPGLIPNTWYPLSLVERLAGTQVCKLVNDNCEAPVIIINFNPLIDTNQGLGSTDWFYGIDSTSAGTDVDFVSTALHEMTHGLGFSSLIHSREEDVTLNCPSGPLNHTTGTLLCNRNDIYSSFLVRHNSDDSITALSELATDAERRIAMTTPNKLLWNSELVANSEFNTLNNEGIGLAQLYSPFVLSSGSSVSHFSLAYTELMEPIQDANLRILGLATPLLWDIGWDPRPKVESIKAGLYLDAGRNGHGFAIEPIANSDLYFTVFYTYKDDGTPEWYTSLSTLENNVLNINSFSDPNDGALNRFIYDFSVDPTGAATPNTLDTSIGTSSLKIDFNQATTSVAAACNDGQTRGQDTALATWQLGDQSGQWCIEPLANIIGQPSAEDFGGTWWTGIDDDGWGLSLSFSGQTIVVTIYYFDEDGTPRWAQGSQPGFQVGQEITVNMLEFTGFARDAEPTELSNVMAGTISLTLNSKTGAGNDGTLNLNINYQGIEGGEWIRTNMPVTIFTEAH